MPQDKSQQRNYPDANFTRPFHFLWYDVCSFLSFSSIPTAGQVVGLYSRFDVIVSVGWGHLQRDAAGRLQDGDQWDYPSQVQSPGCSLGEEVDP